MNYVADAFLVFFWGNDSGYLKDDSKYIIVFERLVLDPRLSLLLQDDWVGIIGKRFISERINQILVSNRST